jgi:hypothetical protein
MSLWRRKAIELMPSYKREIEAANNPMALWIDLRFLIEDEYRSVTRDDALIDQIYAYAHWCLREAKSQDVFTAVVYGFYEELPTIPQLRADLPNRISRKDFLSIDDYWAYHLSEEEFQRFVKEFLEVKDRMLRKSGGIDVV